MLTTSLGTIEETVLRDYELSIECGSLVIDQVSTRPAARRWTKIRQNSPEPDPEGTGLVMTHGLFPNR